MVGFFESIRGIFRLNFYFNFILESKSNLELMSGILNRFGTHEWFEKKMRIFRTREWYL